jgi:hypothetical protein
MKISYIAQFISGVLLLIVTIIFLYEILYNRRQFDNETLIFILIGLATLYSTHGISHSIDEIIYNNNTHLNEKNKSQSK